MIKRIPTVHIALMSIVASSAASIVCMARCDLSRPHQLTNCHDKAPTQSGHHVHHTSHARMVAHDPEPGVVVPQGQQLNSACLSYQSGTCVNMNFARSIWLTAFTHRSEAP